MLWAISLTARRRCLLRRVANGGIDMQARELFQDVFELTDQTILQRLEEASQVVSLKKGQFLCKEGEIPAKLDFLLSGLLRGYFLDANGRDITDCFAYEAGSPAMACLGLGEPTSISIECLTDCQVVEVPIALVTELLEEYPQLYQLYTKMLLKALAQHWGVKTAMHQYDATRRYQWFMRTYPGLHQQISGKHIASFLGMTQVTLSRLRRTLRESGQL